MTSGIVTTAKQGKRSTVVAALGAVCVLTVAVGLAVWQGGRPGGETARVGQVSGQEATMVIMDYPSNRPGVAAAANGPVPTDRVDVPMTVYLAGSAEQADQLRWEIAEHNAHFGAPPSNATVLAMGVSEKADSALLRLLGASDALRDERGLPGMVIVDRREL
jgi:hypothetical protein